MPIFKDNHKEVHENTGGGHTEYSGQQAIQLPNDLKINDDKVYLKKTGNVIYIIPFHSPWQNFYDSLSGFSEDFMKDRNPPSQQNRELFD